MTERDDSAQRASESTGLSVSGVETDTQTDAAEVEALAEALYVELEWSGCDGSSWQRTTPKVRADWSRVARHVAAREAAAEARGAERALREAADEGPLHFAATHTGPTARGWNVVEAGWLRARAAAAAAGGGA